MPGQAATAPRGKGMSLADGCAVLGQEGHTGVVTRGLPVSSVPVLLHSRLRCLHCFPLHPHRLVLSLSEIGRLGHWPPNLYPPLVRVALGTFTAKVYWQSPGQRSRDTQALTVFWKWSMAAGQLWWTQGACRRASMNLLQSPLTPPPLWQSMGSSQCTSYGFSPHCYMLTT